MTLAYVRVPHLCFHTSFSRTTKLSPWSPQRTTVSSCAFSSILSSYVSFVRQEAACRHSYLYSLRTKSLEEFCPASFMVGENGCAAMRAAAEDSLRKDIAVDCAQRELEICAETRCCYSARQWVGRSVKKAGCLQEASLRSGTAVVVRASARRSVECVPVAYQDAMPRGQVDVGVQTDVLRKSLEQIAGGVVSLEQKASNGA